MKKCPALVPALLDIYNLCWRTSNVPPMWKKASINLIPKKTAQVDPSNPVNFRPIALTSCVGKLFSTIMKNRLLSYMLANGFLDRNIQKAFVPSVPGCLEHYAKLATAIHEAHTRHKSLTVCWLDLANAYGSVNHGLIAFSLKHYGVSDPFISLVANFYTGLSASVSTHSWSTSCIPIRKGVFQGDPLSVIIFNTVMNTYIDAVKPHLTSSYRFTDSPQSLGLLQYADDSCLVSNGPASCQCLLDITGLWLSWSGMAAKIPKCQCLAIEASTGKVYDPNLTLSGDTLPFIGNHPVKFLGGVIQVPSDNQAARGMLKSKLDTLLSRIDQTPVTSKQKMLIFKLGVCPRISWDLTINSFPLSWIESSLDPLATRYLKAWLGLAKPADPSRLFLPQSHGGLGLPSISGLYKKLQVGRAALLMSSRDRAVQFVLTSSLKKEASSRIMKFKPATIVQQVFANDPGASRKSLSNKSKRCIQMDEVTERLAHATSLKVQGSIFRIVERAAASIWSKAAESLSPALMKFAMNAAQDTLPHNANLARWRKLPDSCKLCGKRQTLLHILNNCPVALNCRRYNQRHDLVLSAICKFLVDVLDEDYTVISDLADSVTYLFPTILATTDLRPDLVIYSIEKRDAYIVELTVPFETNFRQAQERKQSKYYEIMEEAIANGFDVDLITLEVGSRGFVCPEGFTQLQDMLLVSSRQMKQLMINVSVAAITGSYGIWTSRNHHPNRAHLSSP